MRKVLITFSMVWAVLFGYLLYLGQPADASWIDVERLSIDYIHYFPRGRAPLVTDNGLDDREPGNRLGLDLVFVLPVDFYIANRVESYSDHDWTNGGGQFRSIELQGEIGIRLFPQVDAYYHHRSAHVLDHSYNQGFPVEDGVGIRLKVIGGDKR